MRDSISFSVETTLYDSANKKLATGVESDLNGEVTLEELLRWTKSALITVSVDVLRQEQANGFDKNPVIIVDGRRDKNIYDVSPLGQIQFVAKQNINEILQEAFLAILERSKVVTGQYKASHVVVYNGKQVANDLSSFISWLNTAQLTDKDTVRFVNTAPYARKLETWGVTATAGSKKSTRLKKFSGNKDPILVSRPHGVYYLSYRSLYRKYKQNVFINFKYISGAALGIESSGERRTFARAKHKSGVGRDYIYPSISFQVQSRGSYSPVGSAA